jgi:PqqD family protein of HPr-rel-A system
MTKLRRNEKTAWRTYEEEGVLLDVGSGKVFGLNSTAARIWELLESDITAGELAVRLSDEFSVREEEARADVDEFLAALQSRGLVHVVD